MAPKIPNVTFNNGKTCPIFGLGTWKPVGEEERWRIFAQCSEPEAVKPQKTSAPGEVAQAVKDAIDVGYRHFDCAFIYQNENEVGEGINAKLADGTVKREDLFITSKLWNTFHRPDLVRGACEATLKNLGLKYIDLYLIHWPMAYKEGDDLFPRNDKGEILFSDVDYVDTWKEMEKLVQAGLVKSIGISNFNSKQVDRIWNAATVKPVTNQVECHPYLLQNKLAAHCKKYNIILTAYSPLGSPDRPWAKPDDPRLLDDPKLVKIAEKYKKTVAQVLIRYQLEKGYIVIPKSVTKSRIISNAEVFDFTLSADDVKLIDSFDRNGRFVGLDEQSAAPNYPFLDEF